MERAKRSGLKGNAARIDAQKRYDEALASSKAASPARPRPGARRPTTSTALVVQRPQPRRAVPTLTNRISNLEAYLCNPKYHEAYLRNFGRHVPMPRATATNGATANKTLPVNATIANTYSVSPGEYMFIVPTPEDVYNRPYMVVRVLGGQYNYTFGGWFGGISPQNLFGATPTTGVIDSRALEFKGAQLEITAAVSYNAAASVTVLDPYTAFNYGKALGYEQVASLDLQKSSPLMLGDTTQRPYYTPHAAVVTPSNIEEIGQTFPLVGSSNNSTMAFKQVLRPITNTYFSATSNAITDPQSLGFVRHPVSAPDPFADNSVQYLTQFGQGVFMFNNPVANTSPISVVVKGDYHYRARIDHDSPAVYMMADSKTVPPATISFEPQIAASQTMATAAAIQSQQHQALLTDRARSLPPVPTRAPAVDPKSTDKPSGDALSLIGKIPVVGTGAEKSIRGLERAFTKGDDPAELFGGLADFAMGGFDALGGLFSWL